MRATTERRLPAILSGNNAGAGTAWPLVLTSHPIYALLRNDAILDEAEKLAEANGRPAFLSPQQSETLVAIAESIVPGSTQAQVSRFIDLLLTVDKPENQRKFVESLTAIDAQAQKRYEKSFPALDDKEKEDLLTDASSRPKNAETSETAAENKESELYGHFENLKGWISVLFLGGWHARARMDGRLCVRGFSRLRASRRTSLRGNHERDHGT